MELEQHSVTHLSLHLDPTLTRCPVALSGDADGFSHSDQQATSALFPRSALKSDVFESYYAHLKKLGTVRHIYHSSVYLNWTIPPKKKSLDGNNIGKRKVINKPKENILKEKSSWRAGVFICPANYVSQ